MANKNAWSAPLYRPKYPRLDIVSYSRENDFTFSLGRQTSYEEVLGLLWEAGCVNPSNLLSSVKQLRITKNVDNGQVFVTCANDGVSDIWVDKLNGLAKSDIRKCHSYTDKEIPVKFSFIHASINVQKDIVDGFLCKYGRVKEWFPLKDKRFGIPNGTFIFVMFEEDLAKNPLPECVFLNHIQVYISYRTQVVRCHTCNEAGHYSRECPKDVGQNFPRLMGNQAGAASVFLDGVVPSNVNAKQNSRVSVSQDMAGLQKMNASLASEHSYASQGAVSSSISDKTNSFDNGKKASQSSAMADDNCINCNVSSTVPKGIQKEIGVNCKKRDWEDKSDEEGSNPKIPALDLTDVGGEIEIGLTNVTNVVSEEVVSEEKDEDGNSKNSGNGSDLDWYNGGLQDQVSDNVNMEDIHSDGSLSGSDQEEPPGE